MNKNKGIYLALLTALISGVSIFVNKFAVHAIKQPLVFTFVKNSGVAILLMAVLVLGSKWKEVLKLNKKDLGKMFLVGVIGGSIPFYLFFTGLSSTPAVNGAIIHKTLVIWVAMLAIPFLKEKISFKRAALVAMLFAANVMVGGFKGFKFSQGEFLILLATLFWAVETIIVKKALKNIDPVILVSARMGIGAIVLLVMSVILEPVALGKALSLNTSQWFWLVLTMLTLFGYVTTWYTALKYAPAVTVMTILVGSTLVTNILSAIFVTHSFNTLMVAQATIMVFCIWMLSREETKSILDGVESKLSPVS
ncbi:MAG TPA: DMT family transporter [Candidatus Methanoperedens sp.]|nr:DMT family transporter [Candidatus Methanoperedens sp.]